MSEISNRPSNADTESDDEQNRHEIHSTPSSGSESPRAESDDLPTRRRLGQYGVEVAIGVVLAIVILYVVWASSGEVPFVYEGY